MSDETPSILRHTEGRWTAVPNALLEADDLSWTAKGLYAYMASKPDGWRFNLRHLSSVCTSRKVSTSTALNDLEDAGWLTRAQLRSDGGQLSACEYRLSTVVMFSADGFSADGFSADGKSTTSKTVESKTEESNNPTGSDPNASFWHFWSAYPTEGLPGHARANAYKAYAAALVDGVDPNDLLTAADGYAIEREGEDGQYTIHPHRFIRDELWRGYVSGTVESELHAAEAELEVAIEQLRNTVVGSAFYAERYEKAQLLASKVDALTESVDE